MTQETSVCCQSRQVVHPATFREAPPCGARDPLAAYAGDGDIKLAEMRMAEDMTLVMMRMMHIMTIIIMLCLDG